jgi:hypothetical protein
MSASYRVSLRRLAGTSCLLVPAYCGLMANAHAAASAASAATSAASVTSSRNSHGASTNISLRGIVFAAARSVAVLEYGGARCVCTLNDRLTSGHRISTIEVDRVVLTLHGSVTVVRLAGTATFRGKYTGMNVQPARQNEKVSQSSTADLRSVPRPLAYMSSESASSQVPSGSPWVIPSWLQAGLAGPVSTSEAAKSPWMRP